MNLAQRDSEEFLEVLADLDLSAILVNMERKAFPDTPEQEVLLVSTALLDLQDNRDTEATLVSPGSKDT